MSQTQRAVAYVRVSKTHEETISPELQRHEIEQYAKRRGIDIVEYLEDLDESGRQFTKRKVSRIIEGVKNGQWDAVILWKWSRWGRNLRESLVYLAQMEEVGGWVYAATEDFDQKTSMGRFTRDQMLLIAELQSNQISDGWKEAQARRVRAGLPHTARPRMGYTYVRLDKEPPRYVVDPGTAHLIEEAYRRVLSGNEGIRTVALDWNSRGIRTTQGNQWTPISLGRMLDTGFAAGFIRERSDTRKKGTGSLDGYDIWRRGSHEPIISGETWEAYKALRKANSAKAPRHVTVARALSGLVKCGECGRAMTVAHNHGTIAWRCTLPASLGKGVHASVYVAESHLNAHLAEWIQTEAKGGGDVEQRARHLRAAKRAMNSVVVLEARLTRLLAKRTKLADGWADGLVEDNDYKSLKEHADEQIEVCSSDLEDAKATLRSSKSDHAPMFRGLRATWQGMTPQEQNAALRHVIARIEVGPGRVGSTRKKIQIMPAWL